MTPLLDRIMRWPALELSVLAMDDEQLQPSGWHHFATNIKQEALVEGFRVGETVWMLREPHARAAIAWEWAELRKGIVALADPNSLVSNIRFVGAPMGLERVDPAGRKRLVLNTIVHALPWQEAVLRELKAPAGPMGLRLGEYAH